MEVFTVMFQQGADQHLKVGQRRCKMTEEKVDEDVRRNGFQRCQEFLGGAWTLATIDQFSMEYIP